MRKDRQDLEFYLHEMIKEIKLSRKKVLDVNKRLSNKGVPIGVFDEISKGIKPLSSVEMPLLCILTVVLFEVTNDAQINPVEWFTEKEIRVSRESIAERPSSSRVELPVTMENVISIQPDSYITKVKMSFLVSLFHSQLIVYDYETQRSAKYKRGKEGVVPVPDLNMKSVKDIAKSMLSETYLEDMITLNVYSEDLEALDYNPDSQTLKILNGATISILDGFHRLQGGVRALAINSELDLEMILSVRSYDTETAKKYFGQINTVNTVKKERLKELKQEKFSDLVVRDIQKKSDLRGKIASASKISEIAGQLTTFDIMSFGVDSVYNPKSKLEAKEVADNLITFFDYLAGSFVDEFLSKPEAYRNTNRNHPLIFLGYIVIAKHFTDIRRPLAELKSFIESMDFRDEKLDELLHDRRGINNTKIRKSVIKYFQDKVGE